MPRVLLYTDQPILAEGFRRLFREYPGFELSGVFGSSDDLVEALDSTRPEVTLLDVNAIFSPHFVNKVRLTRPQYNLALWVEELSMQTVYRAFDMGVRGVLSSRLPAEVLVTSLLRIAQGEVYFPNLYCKPRELARVNLSPREKELASLIRQGLKNKAISHIMGLTEGTVKVYLSRLYRRLGVADRLELALCGMHDTGFAPSMTPDNGPGNVRPS